MTLTSLYLTSLGALAQGLVWGVMALGIYITYRLLNLSDLTVDGSFATGGCVCAILLVNGCNIVVCLVLALIAGALAGMVTGILSTKLNIPPILAGILTQLGLYSINLHILGRASQPVLKVQTLFTFFQSLFGSLSLNMVIVIVGFAFIVLLIGLMYWFFGTELGSALRATGSNEKMIRSLGVDTDFIKILGLMLANGLVALSGALVCQTQGTGSVSMGTGAIVIGLASIIIGEVLMSKANNFAVKLSGVVLGSIVYRLIVSLVLQLGLSTEDLKLFTAILVAAALSLPYLMGNYKTAKMVKNNGGAE
ncbi:MAG: ABC transporter permease [Erysipelotrichaceae bacterium]|nr:ABC transporter permease [Erysipelotrichaceae bacterium]